MHVLLTSEPGGSTAACHQCGRPAADLRGIRLTAADGTALCRECVRSAAPALAALFELAELARRVGHVTRHRGLWLPFDDLLEMTRLSKALHEAIDPDDTHSTPPAADSFRKEMP